MSIDVRRRLAAAGFVALLILAVFWPSPVVSINLLCCNAPLAVDDLSFLGREAPSWDVIFWCIAGVFLIAMLQTGDYAWRDFGQLAEALREVRPRGGWKLAAGAIASAVIVAAVWRFADAPAIAAAERLKNDAVEDAIRIVNRFGGGMNPALIAGFFAVAGVVYRTRRWVGYAVRMAAAGLAAGLLAQLAKALVGRSRPEIWLGPFHFSYGEASSFPSGHTVGAFALAGVLLFGSRSLPLRVAALLLATAVGLS
ncbi:MAG TPA: phosphatase PAP2 family protein, partial [Thermoanaerobaculia bacterium]|nr:phosphatase PAP2 family protein [Thermoanaerobaculia bacterium]